jgi:hypothetical protein
VTAFELFGTSNFLPFYTILFDANIIKSSLFFWIFTILHGLLAISAFSEDKEGNTFESWRFYVSRMFVQDEREKPDKSYTAQSYMLDRGTDSWQNFICKNH